jgi:hypothetical protein
MPLITKISGTDTIPEWCTVQQAFLWVSRDILPSRKATETGRDPRFGIGVPRLFDRGRIDLLAFQQLKLKMEEGAIPLRGRPGYEGVGIRDDAEFKWPYLWSEDEWESAGLDEWKDADFKRYFDDRQKQANEIIVPVEDVCWGNFTLHGLNLILEVPDYELGDDDKGPSVYKVTYIDLTLHAVSLLKAFPSRDGQELPYLPKSEISTPSKVTSGGRPQKWDWETCIATTTLKIYSGDLKEGDRASWGRFMAEWFSSHDRNGDSPDARDIRKRTAMIEFQLANLIE